MQVIAQRDGVRTGDEHERMRIWEFRDEASMGEVVLRFIDSGFLPALDRPHAWLLRIAHEAQAVETAHGWWEWKPNGEGEDFVHLFRSLGRGRHSEWQVSDASNLSLPDRALLAERIRPGASGQRMVVAKLLASAGLVSLPDFRDHMNRSAPKLRPLPHRRQRKARPA